MKPGGSWLWWERPHQALPRTLAPVPDELAPSYLRRLAAVNHLDPGAFERWVCGPVRDALPQVEVLAVVSCYPERTLCQAMPQLCPPDRRGDLRLDGRPRPGLLVGPGCIRCNAARGATGPVERWRTHEDVLCRRHLRWTAALYSTLAQPDLANQPEILRAHRRHRRLIREVGREAVRLAYHRAGRILEEWRDGGSEFDAGYVRRMRIFHGAQYRVSAADPTIDAALYPRRVALTRLLAHPYWRALALNEHAAAARPDWAAMNAAMDTVPQSQRSTTMLWDGLEPAQERIRAAFLLPDAPGIRRFAAEVRETVSPDYHWQPLPIGRNRFEPITQWVMYELEVASGHRALDAPPSETLGRGRSSRRRPTPSAAATKNPTDEAAHTAGREPRGALALEMLPAQVADRISAQFAQNTRRAVSSRWNSYAAWCARTGHEPLPASAQQITAYLTHLDSEGRKASTLDAHLGTLSVVIRLARQAQAERTEHGTDCAHGCLHTGVELDLSRARAYIKERRGPRKHAQREGGVLYPSDFRALIDAIPADGPTVLRDRALILLTFALCRPLTEIAEIDLEHITETSDPPGITVAPARHSPAAAGRKHVGVLSAPDSRYCAVAALDAWRAHLRERGHRSGALFLRVDTHGTMGTGARIPGRVPGQDDGRLSAHSVREIIARYTAAAQLTPPPGPVGLRYDPRALRRAILTRTFARRTASDDDEWQVTPLSGLL